MTFNLFVNRFFVNRFFVNRFISFDSLNTIKKLSSLHTRGGLPSYV